MNAKKAEGSVFHVLIFSLPIIISQACDSLMMLTDRYLLAQVNPIFAAAAMSGGMTAFLFWIFGAGLLGFVTPLTAQYMGAAASLMCFTPNFLNNSITTLSGRS